MADSNDPRQYGDERDRLQDSPITEADRRAVRGTITHMDGVENLATSTSKSHRLRADHHVRYGSNHRRHTVLPVTQYRMAQQV